MTICLPIPDRRLSPNSRGHWSSGHKARKQARQLAYLTTRSALRGEHPPPVSGYRLAFYFAARRRRDDDNWSAACKAYRDGIADALGIDDHQLRQTESPAMEIDPANPRLEITLLS